MKDFSKKIEFTANIAIIVIALLLGVVLVERYFFSNSPKSQTFNNRIKKDEIISLPIDWTKREITLLLILSTNCHFCSESGPFYKRLTEELQNQGTVQVIAILPQDISESHQYLNKLGVSVSEIRQEPLPIKGVSGTPTLILTDNTGKVINFWVGKLPPKRENEVINQIKSL
ncbi:MAG: hypothetical protein H0T08_01660 [Acidobacteria bacterium]|jgi:thioredoxin-related protein|nr:hypothetical protein [Acidobacteriota bacterium]